MFLISDENVTFRDGGFQVSINSQFVLEIFSSKTRTQDPDHLLDTQEY